jgi:hypothetical protein
MFRAMPKDVRDICEEVVRLGQHAYIEAQRLPAEQVRRALHTIDLQQGNGQWNLNQIRHILEGKTP